MPRYAPISESRLIACERSRRRSPSTSRFSSMYWRRRVTSSSVRSRIFVSGLRPSESATLCAVGLPIPYTYVSPISSRFWLGRLTPAIRATFLLSLPLLVSRVGADDHGLAMPLDHAAALAHGLDGCSDFHFSEFAYRCRYVIRPRVKS